ncbi:hypothetical protein LJC22_04005 [Desulfosarcina sp. OttesenSCG-928-G10]|nr:hypothetical protein [Desulfosarcina sp. OttesenSCG-928-G10]MDL2321148.1 hypothetical protein [Desulfosarcina sp. OttesenSCG-928-B08]
MNKKTYSYREKTRFRVYRLFAVGIVTLLFWHEAQTRTKPLALWDLIDLQPIGTQIVLWGTTAFFALLLLFSLLAFVASFAKTQRITLSVNALTVPNGLFGKQVTTVPLKAITQVQILGTEKPCLVIFYKGEKNDGEKIKLQLDMFKNKSAFMNLHTSLVNGLSRASATAMEKPTQFRRQASSCRETAPAISISAGLQERGMDEKVYPYWGRFGTAIPLFGLLCFFVWIVFKKAHAHSGTAPLKILGLVELSPGAGQIFLWGMTVLLVFMVLGGLVYFRGVIGPDQVITLSASALTAPEGLFTRRFISVPLAAITDVQIEKALKTRNLVIFYTSPKHSKEKISFQESAFKGMTGFMDLYTCLTEYLETATTDAQKQTPVKSLRSF